MAMDVDLAMVLGRFGTGRGGAGHGGARRGAGIASLAAQQGTKELTTAGAWHDAM